MKREIEHVTEIQKEMGITHNDFYAGLPNLLKDIPYQQSEDTITFQLDGKNVEIMVSPEAVRELGRSVRLPVTFVILRFFDFSEEGIRDFIRHFDLKYLRGGG